MTNACTAVVVAAGSARRMGGIDKAMAEVGGIPMLLRTVRALAKSKRISGITVVTRENLLDSITTMCAAEPKFLGAVTGGSSRAESVLCGLKAVETPLVAIHDGARPLVTVPVIDAAIEAAEICGAAAPAIAVHDTIKKAKNGVVEQTLDRSSLFAVQTPQVFETSAIRSALQAAMAQNLPLTDDCSAAEYAGLQVHLAPGSEENLKITVPSDLILAEAILQRRDGL